MAEPKRQALSRDNPWPGLDPFDETDQEYFYGRTAESEELLRLVRRELLTVLFGRSGLGKTSLLKARLFPRLRKEDSLPVYVRLDHADGAPELRDQIFHELRVACETYQVQASHPAADESLWSFFHRRDAEFWGERNRPVTPVIVFDQFEEIFTLGQKTEAAGARSAAFLAELSDLIENRPSDAVKQALEADPTAARRFDFKRSTAKIVLSFREDFLAEMEGLKERMPSLMYNRFRLLAMSGTQAYEVITRAGRELVDDDVARRILRLAWKNEPSPPVDLSDFPKIEIDPALLSVVCSELNHKRQQTKPPLGRITSDLLEGADREILSGFYERGMAGLDPRVRAFVEDELITDRGYRDSHALEDALLLSGITSEALDVLIRRRLLRVDERQSVRRLELTHDVLTRVVKESRDSRRAREAEKAALAQQRRNRRNAALVLAGALVVIILIALAGWFAWESRQRLREAESTRVLANAERLQNEAYDASLLVNLEAIRLALKPPPLDITAGLLRRFVSHPQLAAFLPGHIAMVHSVAFSRDGKLLASASEDRTVILWNVASRKPIARLEGHNKGVRCVVFSPDGKRLASAGEDKSVILWDVKSHKPIDKMDGHKAPISGIAFSPDGKRLASASGDHTVILWDVESHERLATLEAHTEAVSSVSFSPDGKLLASASEDRTVILWDVTNRKPKPLYPPLSEHKGEVLGIAFSPDGKLLASASEDRTVILWDVVSGKRLASPLRGHKKTVWSVAFSPDGNRLASSSQDQTVILWNVDSQDVDKCKPLVTLEGHKDTVLGVAFSPDGKLLASASNNPAVILWDVDSRKLFAALQGHEDMVHTVAFNPDGKRLASASGDRTVILWDVESRKPLPPLERHKETVSGVAFSPNGKLLASASWDHAVILWDLESRKPLPSLEGHKEAVSGVAFNPDGKRLASASWDKTVILWDVLSRKPLATLKGHKEAVSGIAFSPDGKWLASASWDETVILWDLDSLKPLPPLEGHKDAVSSVAFSPDGKRLASASMDKTVILWDVLSRKPLATLGGHGKAVQGVAFSPDGKRLASASLDETVVLWDLDSRTPLAALSGHKGPVRSVAFSPDGKRLASASDDQTVILWNLDLGHLMAEACRTANRNLTCDEWRNYVGVDKPYHKTCEALPGLEKCD
jgi:WD40 repeat protein